MNWSDKKVIKDNKRIDTVDLKYREYYRAAWGYEFCLLELKVSLTSERGERVRDTFSTRR